MTSQRPRTHVVCSKELKEAVQMCALTCDNFWAEYLTKAEKVGNVIRRLRLDIETLYSQEGRTSSISNYINETEHVLVFLLCRVVFFHESLQSFDSFPVSDFTGAYEAFLNELLVPESLDEVFQIVTLLRKYDTSNTLGTIFLSSVFGSSAYYLSLLPSYTRTLGDSLQKLAQRVHDQAELGRVGRSPGLILSLVEDCYRTVTHIKHFLTACPFLATYMDVGSISRGFSLLVDSIIPCVMHFVITCEEMVSHRLRLQMLLNESYNDALLISAVLLSVGDESCRTDSFRSVSICITSLIVEHTNNSCAMGLRRSGWDYAEWLQVLYSNRTTALSVTEASASHNAYMILINIASESAHVSSMYISWICECLDYSLEATNHTNKDTVAYQSASETSDSVTQLQDMFPSWPDGLAELAVDYYGQDIGGLIEDALIGNLPQNLSYYIEVGHVPAEMKQQSNRLMPLNKKTTAVRKDDTPAPSRLYRPETQSLNTSSIEATVSNPSSYFKTLRNTSFLFNTETQLENKINTLRLLENKVEYDDEPDDSQYIEQHIRSQYPGITKQKDINNT